MAQETNLDNVANNLANSSITAGFRAAVSNLKDLVYQNLVMPGAGRFATDHNGCGPASRPRARVLRRRKSSRFAGRFQPDWKPTRPDHSGARVFSRLASARRRDCLHGARAKLSLGRAGKSGHAQDGNPVQPAVTIPPGATSMTVAQDGTISVTLPGQTAAQRGGRRSNLLFQ